MKPGLEITADGRWYRLSRAADGSATRIDASGDAGVVRILDTSAMNGPSTFQVEFVRADGSYTIAMPTVFATPAYLRFNGMPGPSDYRAWDAVIATPMPSTGSPVRPVAALGASLVVAGLLVLALPALVAGRHTSQRARTRH